MVFFRLTTRHHRMNSCQLNMAHNLSKKDLIPLIETVTGRTLACSDSLLDTGYLDSLLTIQLIFELEAHFSVSIPSTELTHFNFNSLDNILDLINRLQNGR